MRKSMVRPTFEDKEQSSRYMPNGSSRLVVFASGEFSSVMVSPMFGTMRSSGVNHAQKEGMSRNETAFLKLICLNLERESECFI